MKNKPYIYTLPQQFIEDPSVPMHWKLYTLINGFWISGKQVFASNEWFAGQLGCSERNVQKCMKKLEELDLLERIGESQNRTIIPSRGRTGSSWGDELTVRGRGELPVRHTSDSNTSDSNTTSKGKPLPRFNPLGAELLKEFEVVDPKNKTYYGNTTQRGACDFLINEYGFDEVKNTIILLQKTNNLPYFPTITTPFQLKEKWVQLHTAVNKERGKIQVRRREEAKPKMI